MFNVMSGVGDIHLSNTNPITPFLRMVNKSESQSTIQSEILKYNSTACELLFVTDCEL